MIARAKWGLITALTMLNCVTPAFSQSATDLQDRFWLLWETQGFSGTGCPDDSGCLYRREFKTRLLADEFSKKLADIFQQDNTQKGGRLGPALDAPRICQQNGSSAILDKDPELQLLSNKLDALHGLVGVGLNLRNLKAPPGQSSTFGQKLHTHFERKFREAGLIVVSPDEAARLPGQPKLNLFFSFSDPDSTCEYTYSVFASLSQTALLSRDLRTKLSVGVWSFSTKPSVDHPDATEFDAVVRVADAFLKDYREANARIPSK